MSHIRLVKTNVALFLICATIVLFVGAPTGMRADEKPARISVATWNLEWFYDDHTGDNFSDLAKKLSAPSKAEWDWRVEKVAAAIAEMNPTIIALQEIENRKVLFDLRNKLRENHKLDFKIAFIEGFDPFTEQDVAIMFQSGLVEFSMKQQSQEMWDSDDYRNLPKHIFARFEWGEGKEKEQLLIANVHLKATPESVNTRNKQLLLLRKWLEEEREKGENVIALGDFNTETDCESPEQGTEMHIVRGLDTGTTNDDLFDVHTLLAKADRSTHMIGKQFDRILISPSLREDDPDKVDLVFRSVVNRRDVAIVNAPDVEHRDNYYEIPQSERDLSDHYPIVAVFDFK